MGATKRIIEQEMDKKRGQQLFDDCACKGTFANCNPLGCLRCHEELDMDHKAPPLTPHQ